MPIHSKGVVTGRDKFVLDFDQEPILERMRVFAESNEPDAVLVERYNLNPTAWWHVDKARLKMPPIEELHEYIRPVLYRPFDTRYCFYHPAVFMSPRRPVMKNIDSGTENILLITSRMTKGEEFQHVMLSKGLAEAILLSSKTSNNAIIFPLYCYPNKDNNSLKFDSTDVRHPNFTEAFLKEVSHRINLPVINGYGDLKDNMGVDDLFGYIVAILHSPQYRKRYADPLTRDFPRIPLTSNINLFRALTYIGQELISINLMESSKLDNHLTRFSGNRSSKVENISWSNETVYIDKNKATGFQGVPENVWNFHIGGYQVCQKWLKDRGPKRGKPGRTLSSDDINHYHRIVVAINETIRIMTEIDKVIDSHGGWPDAFLTDKDKDEKYTTPAEPELKVAEQETVYQPMKQKVPFPKKND